MTNDGGGMVKNVGKFYSIFCVVLACVLLIIYGIIHPSNGSYLRIVAKAVYYVGIVVAIGMAGLPWIFNKN